MREMRMFARAAAYARAGFLTRGRLERRLLNTRFHMIDTSDVVSLQRTGTKLLAYGPFLEELRQQGRLRAAAWLSAHAADIGRRATLDVNRHFG
jgi:NTE family protein